MSVDIGIMVPQKHDGGTTEEPPENLPTGENVVPLIVSAVLVVLSAIVLVVLLVRRKKTGGRATRK